MMDILQLLESIMGEICDDYCKYPLIYSKEEDEDKLMEQCEKCPFLRKYAEKGEGEGQHDRRGT